MRKSLCILLLFICYVCNAQMYSWRSLLAYGNATNVEVTPKMVYVQAGAALYAVDLTTEETITYSKQDGLHGASIAQIAYSNHDHCLVIMYENGLIDFLYDNGDIISMMDISQKDMTVSKKANAILMVDSLAYVSMPFGLLVLNTAKRQVVDTYYIGENGSEVNILGCALTKDSIFAYGEHTIYSISRQDNPMDFSYWKREVATADITYSGMGVYNDSMYVLKNDLLSKRVAGQWQTVREEACSTIIPGTDGLYLPLLTQGYLALTNQGIAYTHSLYRVYDVQNHGRDAWLAMGAFGAVRVSNGESQIFAVNGPLENIPYRLKVANQKLYVVPGGRWATQNNRPGNIMIYDIIADEWTNIPYATLVQKAGDAILDLMNVAVDPQDPEHYFVTCYGRGLLEMQGTEVRHYYTYTNSPLQSAAPGPYANAYVRTDAAMFDDQNNLWLINTEVSNNIHVASPEQIEASHHLPRAKWDTLALSTTEGVMVINTSGEMFMDNRQSNWKWIPSLRSPVGLFLLDDRGTPHRRSDDKTVFHGTFVDQDGNTVMPTAIYAVAQDKDGTLWVSLENGLITIPAKVDFQKSNACERIKIPRNDGTNLADYLLNTEKINAIAVDGANRKWFGTAASGLYLISEDGLETIEHFTEENSPLPSNEILSLAIEPITGQVFIGTGAGLMVYQSDASMPSDSYSNAYAYPNPVRPDYEGVITITGLMDESAVHIIDNAGNLVCQTRSYGGQAVWDGKTGDGRRVASGVYSALCNEPGGGHAVVKILVMH